jgi:hypothetical protein
MKYGVHCPDSWEFHKFCVLSHETIPMWNYFYTEHSEIWKLQVHMFLHPQEKCDCHYLDVHEIHTLLKMCKEPLYLFYGNLAECTVHPGNGVEGYMDCPNILPRTRSINRTMVSLTFIIQTAKAYSSHKQSVDLSLYWELCSSIWRWIQLRPFFVIIQ